MRTMKKFFNRTVMSSLICILFACFILYEGTHISKTLVNNEPGPTFFPYIADGGLVVLSILSAIFDGKDEENNKPFLTREAKKRLFVILAEIVLFILGMQTIGFLPTALVMMTVIVRTLSDKIKLNKFVWIAVVAGVSCGTYFGFKYGLGIPFPVGTVWEALGY